MGISSMQIFKLSKDRILQLISKERLDKWKGELPLVYFDKIRMSTLPKYRAANDQKVLNKYLDEVLQEIAIPKLKDKLQNFDINLKTIEPDLEDNMIEVITLIRNVGRDRTDLIDALRDELENLSKSKVTDISRATKDLLEAVG